MIIYKVEEALCGSYESGYETYFETLQKAKSCCKAKGFYRESKYFGDGKMESPFYDKRMLKVGDFLLDVTDKWISGENYDDDDLWTLPCDFMSISEVNVY